MYGRALTLHDEICERVARLAPAPVAAAHTRSLTERESAGTKSGGCYCHGSRAGYPSTQVRQSCGRSAAKTVDRVPCHNRDWVWMRSKSLALGLTTFPLQSVPGKTDGSDPIDAPITLRELWEHAIGCAAVLRRGLLRELITVSPHQAFVAGFLHDMGRIASVSLSQRRLLASPSPWLRIRVFHSPKPRPWLWE